MNEPEHLLIVALEECAEIEQRITKALRFGFDEIQPVDTGGDGIESNRARISYEVDDLLAVLRLLDIPFGDIDKMLNWKFARTVRRSVTMKARANSEPALFEIGQTVASDESARRIAYHETHADDPAPLKHYWRDMQAGVTCGTK